MRVNMFFFEPDNHDDILMFSSSSFCSPPLPPLPPPLPSLRPDLIANEKLLEHGGLHLRPILGDAMENVLNVGALVQRALKLVKRAERHGIQSHRVWDRLVLQHRHQRIPGILAQNSGQPNRRKWSENEKNKKAKKKKRDARFGGQRAVDGQRADFGVQVFEPLLARNVAGRVEAVLADQRPQTL